MLLRQTQSVRPVVQMGAICGFLLYFGTVSWAPTFGLVEPVAVRAEPVAPNPVTDPPQYLDFSELRTPRVRARAAVIYNPRTHEVLWESHARELRSIASITKVMTALVFLDDDPDLTRDVVVSRRDVRRASTTYLRRGERIRLRDVLHLALVASDNAAARVLARVSHGGTVSFVERMNAKAVELGLRNTTFADPSGLNQRNLSTAYEVSRLISHASEQPQVGPIMRKSSYRMQTSRRALTVRNTNRLLRGRMSVRGGKTGYIDASGYCLAAVVNIRDSEPLAVVVLGVGSSSGRYRDVTRLVDWVSNQGRSLLSTSERSAN